MPIKSYNKAEQFAYWINLYNALTVEEVLSDYPVASIREIRSGFFKPGPWQRQLLTIEGESICLDDIEPRILRPIYRDTRVHYALNCAALGCPNLAIDAYTSPNTGNLLEQSARDYVNHPRGISVTGNSLRVSMIYDWFMEDFGQTQDEVLNHIKQYADSELSNRLSQFSSYNTIRYDWSLNDTSVNTRQERDRAGGGGGGGAGS